MCALSNVKSLFSSFKTGTSHDGNFDAARGGAWLCVFCSWGIWQGARVNWLYCKMNCMMKCKGDGCGGCIMRMGVGAASGIEPLLFMGREWL